MTEERALELANARTLEVLEIKSFEELPETMEMVREDFISLITNAYAGGLMDRRS